MSHNSNQKVIHSVGGNWFAWAADMESRYRKEVMELENDVHCKNCGRKEELTDGLCWNCISELEGEKS